MSTLELEETWDDSTEQLRQTMITFAELQTKDLREKWIAILKIRLGENYDRPRFEVPQTTVELPTTQKTKSEQNQGEEILSSLTPEIQSRSDEGLEQRIESPSPKPEFSNKLMENPAVCVQQKDIDDSSALVTKKKQIDDYVAEECHDASFGNIIEHLMCVQPQDPSQKFLTSKVSITAQNHSNRRIHVKQSYHKVRKRRLKREHSSQFLHLHVRVRGPRNQLYFRDDRFSSLATCLTNFGMRLGSLSSENPRIRFQKLQIKGQKHEVSMVDFRSVNSCCHDVTMMVKVKKASLEQNGFTKMGKELRDSDIYSEHHGKRCQELSHYSGKKREIKRELHGKTSPSMRKARVSLSINGLSHGGKFTELEERSKYKSCDKLSYVQQQSSQRGQMPKGSKRLLLQKDERVLDNLTEKFMGKRPRDPGWFSKHNHDKEGAQMLLQVKDNDQAIHDFIITVKESQVLTEDGLRGYNTIRFLAIQTGTDGDVLGNHGRGNLVWEPGGVAYEQEKCSKGDRVLKLLIRRQYFEDWIVNGVINFKVCSGVIIEVRIELELYGWEYKQLMMVRGLETGQNSMVGYRLKHRLLYRGDCLIVPSGSLFIPKLLVLWLRRKIRTRQAQLILSFDDLGNTETMLVTSELAKEFMKFSENDGSALQGEKLLVSYVLSLLGHWKSLEIKFKSVKNMCGWVYDKGKRKLRNNDKSNKKEKTDQLQYDGVKWVLVKKIWKWDSDFKGYLWLKLIVAKFVGGKHQRKTTVIKLNRGNSQRGSLLENLKGKEDRTETPKEPNVVKFPREHPKNQLASIFTFDVFHFPRPPDRRVVLWNLGVSVVANGKVATKTLNFFHLEDKMIFQDGSIDKLDSLEQYNVSFAVASGLLCNEGVYGFGG